MARTTIALLIWVAAAGAEEPNLLKNGGFESKLDGWFWQSNSRRAKAELDRGTKVRGRYALRIDKQGGFPADVLGQSFPVPAKHQGGRYTVSVRARCKGIVNGWLKFYLYNRTGDVMIEDVAFGRLHGSYNWKILKGTFAVPKGTTSAKLIVQVFVGGGSAWFDEFSVTWQPAKKREAAPELDPKAKRWLDQNAFALEGVDIKGRMADLRPLRKILKNVRIVQLGEPSHGDGVCFQAKCRLIRWLHEELGFDVVAFESGFFSCDRVNEQVKPGADPREVMRSSIFGVWHTRQTLPLFEYAVRQSGTAKPLLFAGVDPQRTGNLSRAFVDRFLRFLSRAGVDPGKSGDLLRDLDEKMGAKGGYEGFAGASELLGRLEKLLVDHRKKLVARHGEQELAFWARALLNYEVGEILKRTPDQTEYFNLRDKWQGENLIWLAEQRYPEKKIICWAATRHIAHNMKTIVREGEQESLYGSTRAWGEYVHEHFGRRCYTVGFAAYGGRAGWWFKAKWELPTPQEGSIERVCFRYGKPLLFVNLRAPGGPFDARLTLGALGYARMRAKWGEVLDGLVYIERMEPASSMR